MSADHDVARFDRWAATYDRHWMQRWIFKPVQAEVLRLAAREIAQPAAVLDVGCGTGRLLRSAFVAFPQAELVGVDPAPSMVRIAQGLAQGAAIRFIEGTSEQLPSPDGRFDFVFSTLTFHHWHDQAKGAAEVARVMTPRGRWLLADFVPRGYAKVIGRFFGGHFPERARLDAMLGAAALDVRSEHRVKGFAGQLTILVIAAL